MLKHQFVTSGAVAVALAITVGSPAVATSHQEQSPEAYRGAGNGASDLPDVSVNGRYVVFQSSSTNLVPGDTNARIDVFLRDTALNKTRLISKARAGGPANGDSTDAVVSDDGKIIVFTSTASNIVAGDTNGKPDVFRTDLSTGITTRVSTSQTGTQANKESKRGRISSDGKTVAFISSATNIVPGDTNNVQDIFVRTYATATVKRVSTTPNGTQLTVPSYSPSVSFDGKAVGWINDPFGDPAVNAWCGSVGKTLAVLSKKVSSATRPVVVEAVCKSSYLDKVVDPRINMTGKIGFTLLSNGGYAMFAARGQGALVTYNYNADYYTRTWWDEGRWGSAMVSTSEYDDYLHVNDTATGEKDIYWPANSLAMSPDGTTIALQDRSNRQVYIYNHNSGDSKLVSQS